MCTNIVVWWQEFKFLSCGFNTRVHPTGLDITVGRHRYKNLHFVLLNVKVSLNVLNPAFSITDVQVLGIKL